MFESYGRIYILSQNSMSELLIKKWGKLKHRHPLHCCCFQKKTYQCKPFRLCRTCYVFFQFPIPAFTKFLRIPPEQYRVSRMFLKKFLSRDVQLLCKAVPRYFLHLTYYANQFWRLSWNWQTSLQYTDLQSQFRFSYYSFSGGCC